MDLRLKGGTIARFEEKYIPVPESGCWLWTACTNKDGYGAFRFNDRNNLAHRASYEIQTGPIPEGAHVLHKCDNPSCVNPDHLFLGSHQDNMDDMKNKGRSARGQSINAGHKNPSARLTRADVLAIISRYKSGEAKQVELAYEYGVNPEHISNICRGKAWRGVGI